MAVAATASGIASTWDNYYMDSVRHLAADGAIGGKFYYYGFTNGWVYASTDQGASFTQVGGLPSWGYWSQLKSVPGQSNNLFYVTGYDAYGAIYKSTDGGTTWSANYALYPVWAIGFGKAQTSGGYPTIFVYGYDVSGGRGWGVFRSTNAGASWTKCADCPLGIFNKVTIVNGDMNVFGKVFIGWSGNGFAYGYAP